MIIIIIIIKFTSLDYVQRHPVKAMQYRIAYRLSCSGVRDAILYPYVNAKYGAVE
jgi:hypothetical protein